MEDNFSMDRRGGGGFVQAQWDREPMERSHSLRPALPRRWVGGGEVPEELQWLRVGDPWLIC